MRCDAGEVTERLENELCSAHSPTFVTSATSQRILQPFFRFSYVTWRAAPVTEIGNFKFLMDVTYTLGKNDYKLLLRVIF